MANATTIVSQGGRVLLLEYICKYRIHATDHIRHDVRRLYPLHCKHPSESTNSPAGEASIVHLTRIALRNASHMPVTICNRPRLESNQWWNARAPGLLFLRPNL